MSDKSDNSGGSAFPGGSNQDAEYSREFCYPMNTGMSLRDYACIHLRIPETGEDWLDEIIQKARRDHFAGLAMQGLLSGDSHPDIDPMTVPGDVKLRARWACRLANAMLAEQDKKTGAEP